MRRLFTSAWLARHCVAAALVTAFLGLGWWQIRRAASGHSLSWAYAVEWPVFAAFVVFIWWREVRREISGGTGGRSGPEAVVGRRPAGRPARAAGIRRPVLTTRSGRGYPAGGLDPGDPELSAYNDYLAWLNANPDARPGDYPGRA